MKEILLYSPIYSWSAATFIKDMEAAKDSDICIRANCPGGDMYSYNGMVAKYLEHTKGRSVKVDGMAASAMALFCLEVPKDEVECNEESCFLFHRAAGAWTLEDEKDIDAVERKELDKINARARKSLEKRVDADAWQAITGSTIDDLFSMDKRLDVTLTASQAKHLGIVGKVNPLTSEKKKEIEALAAHYQVIAFSPAAIKPKPIITNSSKPNKMTAAEIKAHSPEAYNAIFALGEQNEKIRVSAWAEWMSDAPKEVIAGIESGKEINKSDMSKFSRMVLAKTLLGNAVTENAPEVSTPAPTPAASSDISLEETPEFKAKAAHIISLLNIKK